jgi:hypothetical protein
MQFRTQFITKLTLGLVMSAMGPCSYNAMAGQDPLNASTHKDQINAEFRKGMQALGANNVHGAKDSLNKVKQLAGNAQQYQTMITFLQDRINEKQGVEPKPSATLGKQPVQKVSPPPESDIDQKDIDAFDNAFDNNKITEMARIIKRIESTPGNSPKKEHFLAEAREMLVQLQGKTRTPVGFSNALNSFNLESKKGLSSANIALAKDSLAKMKQYATSSETTQSQIKQAEEKIKEYEKSVMGTKTRTPMGNLLNQRVQSPLQPPQKGPEHQATADMSDEDIAAFKSAYEMDNVAKAKEIFKKYPRTAQDSQKKKDTLDLWDMQLQTMG